MGESVELVVFFIDMEVVMAVILVKMLLLMMEDADVCVVKRWNGDLWSAQPVGHMVLLLWLSFCCC